MDTALLILILITGFYMAWSIGANDVANAMGTSVGSGSLTLRQAVLIAAVLEFCGAFFFGSHVSKTVQSGIIDPDIFIYDPKLLVFGMLASLGSVGMWLQLASYFGWPVSTTHSIVGAIVGFGIVFGGIKAVYWKEVCYIITSWIFSPILGGIIAYYIFSLLRKRIFYALNPLEETRRLTPFLVFVVTLILAVILIFEGLHNLNVEFSLTSKILMTLAIGLMGSFVSYLLVRRIPIIPQEKPSVPYNSEALHSLEKVRKHLQRFRMKSAGEAQYTAGLLLEEVEALSKTFESKINTDHTHVEYVQVEKIFAYLQIMTACMMAFAHGANDVANAIGPLSAAVAILTTGLFAVDAPVPTWALALGGSGIVVGLATWGWRVIETIGKKITELTASRGFAAEFGAATTIVIASRFGLPISTTHTLVGAVLGVGFARGLEAVNLTTTRDILVSWIVTVPIGALLAIILIYPIQAIFG
ncbi:putative phosphate permease [Candidatus Protochlamydia amoebophila]|uniref:inorganic phosphate transporter n=1 Tax=Candidatus Protochlamydia amoebophila TaxID=362787 RepID=UPI001BCA5F16|nr:inorganic phosphate transporter [Candidatus Protochlamydia amoebophila]MBS4163367.1 putative phosphate permease [Candidatus Protochlamydia amoebophila]